MPPPSDTSAAAVATLVVPFPSAGLAPRASTSAGRSDSWRKAYRGAFGVSLMSKVAGFVRELVIAQMFGASPVANLYFTAAQVPVYVQSFFFGAFALPTVPVMRERASAGGLRSFAQNLGRRAAWWIAGGALFGWIVLSLTRVPPPGMARAEMALFLAPLFVCCALVPIAGLAYCAMLARGETTRASALPALMNVAALSLLAAGWLLFGATPLVLTVAAAGGIAVQALIAWRGSRRFPEQAAAPVASRGTEAWPPRYRRGLWLAVVENACFSAAFFWQSQLYGAAIAGGTALFFYAYRIANFPFLLFVAPAQQLAYRRDPASTHGPTPAQKLRVYLAIAAIGLAAAGALALVGAPLIRWVYERGAMTAEACAGVAAMAAPLCLSLLAISLVQTAGRFLSQHGGHAVYVAVVIPMYLAANLARLVLLPEHDLGAVVLGGAAVEFAAAGVLVGFSLKQASS